MFQGVASDRIMMYEKQEQGKDYLSKMKHITGDFNRWITRFEDQMETCETIGVDLSEEAKILYFMNNLNDSIFGDIKANFLDLSTLALFPKTYEELKQRMIAEYGQISMRKPHTVIKVIKGEDSKRYGESSFKAEEEGCHICGIPGHFYKSCKHFRVNRLTLILLLAASHPRSRPDMPESLTYPIPGTLTSTPRR